MEDPRTIHTSSGTVTLRPDGIVVSTMKPGVRHTLAMAEESIEAMREITKGRPHPILLSSSSNSIDEDARKRYMDPDSMTFVLAVALVTDSMVGRIVGNFMMGSMEGKVPVRLFNKETEAVAWLQQQKRAARL